MNEYKIKTLFFSPTGNTEKAVTKIARELSDCFNCVTEAVNFTLPEERNKQWSFDERTIVVFGVPVYAGRVPNKILPFIKENIEGGKALAVPVVTFGNRSYDDALSELRDLLEEAGFRTIAGAAVVGRHPFSDVLAAGRPDEDDLSRLEVFSKEICLKITGCGDHSPVKVKGASPATEYYRPKGISGEATNFLKAKPKTDMKKCTDCGLCARSCPMGSIDGSDVSRVSGICIKCHACVTLCPVGAKYFDDPAFLSHAAMLDKEYSRRAENEFFI